MAQTRHFLAPNKDTRKPEHHIFFDVETAPVKISDTKTRHVLKLAYALYWRRRTDRDTDTLETSFFTAAEELFNFISDHTKKRATLYVFSHNLDFDFGVCNGFTQMKRLNFKLVSLYTRGMTTIIKLRRENASVIFLDNTNFFKCSLKALGEIVGLPKLEVNFDTVNDPELRTYCKRDVEIIYQARKLWYAFCDKHDLGKAGFTLPGQAFNAFRHRFMHDNMLIHGDEETVTLERASYRGGRCSVFYLGEVMTSPVYKLDINSAYPWAMKQHKIPIQHLFTSNNVTCTELQDWLTRFCVIAEVELNTTDNPFPIRQREHNIYPIGQFTTTLTTPELEYALSQAWIVKVKKAAIYKWRHCFDDYIDFFYNLKVTYQHDTNDVFRHIAKLFLNSLYGKFGQRATKFVLAGTVDDVVDEPMIIVDAGSCKRHEMFLFGDQLFVEVDEGEAHNSMVAIAAHITAYVRMHLFTLRQIAGYNHVYYCDTDSLLMDETGYQNSQPYLDPVHLGMMKVEDVSEKAVITAPKTYFFHEQWTRKGIPYKSVEIQPNVFEFEKFQSLRGLAKADPDLGYYTERSTRTLKNTIFDGKVGEDGWVLPFSIGTPHPPTEDELNLSFQISQVETELNALRQAKRISQTLMFTLWDYPRGEFRRTRTSSGGLTSIEHSRFDSLATELGFNTVDDLMSSVQAQVKIDSQINDLEDKLDYLKSN